ncbi:pyridoxamine 5'-phosphate oxidase family protein [Sphaerisporangium dianthi]|uniref:Pyridoxamine 5'-phosphate oxidase family protein n=1 Tax=Sphaerisporangium dianthi TaxID=1436120 RepID=A0ABV9C8J0_9ACTN
MASWQEIEREVPELAARVVQIMAKGKHKTMATLRKDGSPRISGIEVEFKQGEVWFGSMPGAVKALDLRRDPRLAVHSPSEDADEADPSSWSGDAKLAGKAVEITDEGVRASYGGPPGQEFHLFRIDVTEIVLTRVDDDAQHLVIEMWHEPTGHRVVRRK